MQLGESPFSISAEEGIEGDEDEIVTFDGSFSWVWARTTSEGDEEDDNERRAQQKGLPNKRQKTTLPNLDDPSTWQVDELNEDLQMLVEDAASKGLVLPTALLTFLTSRQIYDAYFDVADSHYIKLGSRRLVPFAQGFLLEFLRCNQDANFMVLFLAGDNNHCVAWTNEEFDWDALAAAGKDEKYEKQPQKLDQSDFSFYAASAEEGLWKLKCVYDDCN